MQISPSGCALWDDTPLFKPDPFRDARVKKVLDAAAKYHVAIEISSSFKLPRLSFLEMAKAAQVKFSFRSNGRYPNMGQLDYSVKMAKELGLTRAHMFSPAPDGQKAVQRRTWS